MNIVHHYGKYAIHGAERSWDMEHQGSSWVCLRALGKGNGPDAFERVVEDQCRPQRHGWWPAGAPALRMHMSCLRMVSLLWCVGISASTVQLCKLMHPNGFQYCVHSESQLNSLTVSWLPHDAPWLSWNCDVQSSFAFLVTQSSILDPTSPSVGEGGHDNAHLQGDFSIAKPYL